MGEGSLLGGYFKSLKCGEAPLEVDREQLVQRLALFARNVAHRSSKQSPVRSCVGTTGKPVQGGICGKLNAFSLQLFDHRVDYVDRIIEDG
jgi:hypothetical protein